MLDLPYLSAVRLYINSGHPRMKRAIEQRDPQSLTRGAHSLKSTANIFGASALAEIALVIENLGPTEEFEEATSLLGGVETEVRHVLAALESQTGRGATSR